MSSSLRLRHQIGQLFIVGLGGTALDATERAWLRLIRPSGFILFRRNMEEPAQTTALLQSAIESSAAENEHIPTLRTVDLEGGLVDRFRDMLGPMPSAAAVAATKSRRDAKLHGELIGRAVRLLGFNTTFAPVLDLALPTSLPVMQTRVYGTDADEVSEYARPFFAGLRTEWVLGCGKHFPGLGGGNRDSHHATPRITRTWQQLWEEDIAPYRDLRPYLSLIMVAHAIYSRVHESEEIPASISPFWINTILRKRMGYDGLILTDDMEMGGLLSKTSIEEAAVSALLAGADLLEVCRDPALLLRAYEAVLGEAERSPVFRVRIRRISNRVIALKQKLLPLHPLRAATPEQLRRLRVDMQLMHTNLDARARAATASAQAAQEAAHQGDPS